MLGTQGGQAAPAPAVTVWDETGVDYPMPQIPDIREVTPAVAKARSVARAAARAAGATEEQAELAAFVVPEDIEDRKSLTSWRWKSTRERPPRM